MVGGSQLTQLKSALSDAGIARQSAGKKRKRGSAKDTEKDKKAQLQEIQQKLNPFLLKITKVKHDIGGRKLKGVIGKPVISNQAGIEQVCKLIAFQKKQAVLKYISERKLCYKNLKQRTTPAELLTVASEKMIPLFRLKSECLADSRKKDGDFLRLLLLILTMMKN